MPNLSFSFNPFAIPPLISALVIISMGVFVLSKDIKNKLNVTFFGFCLSTFIWLIFYVGVYLTINPTLALSFSKLAFIGVIFIPIFNYHFTVSFLRLSTPKTLLTFYAIAIAFIFLSPGNLIYDDIHTYFWGFYPEAGPLCIYYVSFFAFVWLVGLVLLFRGLKERKRQKKLIEYRQIQYILFAFLLGTLGILDFATKFGIVFYPWGYFWGLLWISLLTYTMVRYRIASINFFLRRSLAVLFAYCVFSVPIFLVTYLIDIYRPPVLVQTLLFLIFFSLIGMFFLKLKIRTEVTFLQFLAKGPYQYHDTLIKLSKDLVSELDLEKLLRESINALSQSLVVKKVEIYLYSGDQLGLKASTESEGSNKKIFFKPSSPLYPEGKVLFKDEIEKYGSAKILDLFNIVEADVLIPVIYKEELLAICVLGNSQIDYSYSEEDITVFKIFSNQVAIALKNAQTYQMIQELNVTLEQKVKERSDQLIQAQKLASIGQLVAGIAHHINNKINPPIQGADVLTTALSKIKNGSLTLNDALPDIELAIDAISSELSAVKTIVDDLLISSRQASHQFQFAPLDLNTLVQSVVRMIRTDCLERVKIHEEYADNLPEIRGDQTYLDDVFVNLIKNAVEAIREKGNVRIKTWNEDRSNFISIRDDGAGISEENLSKIFDFFFTTKDVGKGTGLGLSVSYATIKEHGGDISVKSRPNHGTEFMIRLPVL